jgi:hypothetical protein
MLRAHCVKAFVVLVLLVGAALVQAEEAEMTPGRYWHFVENVEVAGDAPEVRLWVALPVEHRGQKVEVGEIYPEPAAVVDDPLGGNRVILWRLTDLEGADDAYAYYDFKFAGELVSGKDIDPEKIEPYDEASPDYQQYMRSEPWIEVTDAIRAKAGEIVGDEHDALRSDGKTGGGIELAVTGAIRAPLPEERTRGPEVLDAVVVRVCYVDVVVRRYNYAVRSIELPVTGAARTPLPPGRVSLKAIICLFGKKSRP